MPWYVNFDTYPCLIRIFHCFRLSNWFIIHFNDPLETSNIRVKICTPPHTRINCERNGTRFYVFSCGISTKMVFLYIPLHKWNVIWLVCYFKLGTRKYTNTWSMLLFFVHIIYVSLSVCAHENNDLRTEIRKLSDCSGNYE